MRSWFNKIRAAATFSTFKITWYLKSRMFNVGWPVMKVYWYSGLSFTSEVERSTGSALHGPASSPPPHLAYNWLLVHGTLDMEFSLSYGSLTDATLHTGCTKRMRILVVDSGAAVLQATTARYHDLGICLVPSLSSIRHNLHQQHNHPHHVKQQYTTIVNSFIIQIQSSHPVIEKWP